jgi:hypothetical protein
VTWNHRVIQHDDGTLGIYEVYYDDDGKPYMWTEDAFVIGDDADELMEELTRMVACIANDWLEMSDLMGQPDDG